MTIWVSPLKCERCHEWPASLAFLDDEDVTRYFDVPPWCAICLEEEDWHQYWLEQLKRDYESGKLQS